MKCLRCLNTDTHYFYTRNNIVYCRKCVAYGRVVEIQKRNMYESKVTYHLEYLLTKQQKEMSEILLNRYQQNKNTKLKAVCGAGKTEILYDVITYALNQGHRVCLTIPRRELVKELAQRIASQFQNLNYSVVYGGHVNDLEGQLVICTCHQLFRFPQAFELLILDEEDAFPYKNNEVLQNIVAQSCNGQYIHMSATLDASEANISLHTRYHGHRLPIPKCHIRGHWLSVVCMIKKLYRYKNQNKPVLVYVAAIKDTYEMHKLLSYFKIRCGIAHSKCMDMHETILKLKQGQLDCIVTTTILERGITIENIQVIILGGQHQIYENQTLLQICGRVGRKVNYPTGDITIFTVFKTKAIRQCIRTLKEDNVYCV